MDLYKKVVAAGGQGGTVSVSVFTPDLQPLKNLHVTIASKEGVLLQTLQAVIQQRGLKPGETLVKPRVQFLPQNTVKGDLALHLTARRFEEEEQLPGQFPGESWIVYKAAEIPQLLGGNLKPAVGAEWDIPEDLAKRLLMHVYPQEILSDRADLNRIQNQKISARVISVENGAARVRLEATLVMDRAHTMSGGVNKLVIATLSGYMDFSLADHEVLAFKMATFKATANGREFKAGITSEPMAYAQPVKP